MRTHFELARWNQLRKIRAPQGRKSLAQHGAATGSPIRAAFARIGVGEAKCWVKWKIDPSPFRDGTVLTHTLKPCPFKSHWRAEFFRSLFSWRREQTEGDEVRLFRFVKPARTSAPSKNLRSESEWAV